MECLSEGVPLIAIPIANDQSGVASRIARVGAGEFIPIKKLTSSNLRDAVHRGLKAPTYGSRAKDCARELQPLRGPSRAAELIEVAFTTRQRLKRSNLNQPREMVAQ